MRAAGSGAGSFWRFLGWLLPREPCLLLLPRSLLWDRPPRGRWGERLRLSRGMPDRPAHAHRRCRFGGLLDLPNLATPTFLHTQPTHVDFEIAHTLTHALLYLN